MKKYVVIVMLLVVGFSCTRQGSTLNPGGPNTSALLGSWDWASTYNAGFDIAALKLNQGTLVFNSDKTWKRIINNVTVDQGTYAVFSSTISTADSIQFNRATAPPAHPILDSTYDYFTVSGNTLKLGDLGLQNYIILDGTVAVYTRAR